MITSLEMSSEIDTLKTLYGIKNCDTVRKARKWLSANRVEHIFHDFRDEGITSGLIEQWLKHADLASLINKRSTSWKALDESAQGALNTALSENATERDIASALALLIEAPTLIKRPVLASSTSVEVGFSEKRYQALLEGGQL